MTREEIETRLLENILSVTSGMTIGKRAAARIVGGVDVSRFHHGILDHHLPAVGVSYPDCPPHLLSGDLAVGNDGRAVCHCPAYAHPVIVRIEPDLPDLIGGRHVTPVPVLEDQVLRHFVRERVVQNGAAALRMRPDGTPGGSTPGRAAGIAAVCLGGGGLYGCRGRALCLNGGHLGRRGRGTARDRGRRRLLARHLGDLAPGELAAHPGDDPAFPVQFDQKQ